MKRRAWSVGLLAAAAALMSGAARGQTPSNPWGDGLDPRGQIPIRNMRPYNLLFLQFMPESSDVLPVGQSVYSAQIDLANNLLIPTTSPGATVVEDNEYQRLLLSWHRGLGRRLELGVFLPIEWRDGGFLDGIISAYHQLVGLPGNTMDDPYGRGHWPKYRSILEVIQPDGQVTIDQGNGFGLGDVSVTLKRGLVENHRASADVRLGIKLPTGNPDLLLGSGKPDVGLSLDAQYRLLSNVITYANLGFVAMGPSSVPGAEHEMVQGFVGLEYRATRRDSFLFQIDRNTLAVRTGNTFADGPQVTALWGYERILTHHLMLWGAYVENGDIHDYELPDLSNIGPDITFTAGLKWHP